MSSQYYELMTPTWLDQFSTITPQHTANPKYLEITGTTAHGRAIKVQLIAPDVLTATDNPVVTLTIAMDTAFTNNHNPTFGISDGTSFVGFQVPGITASANTPPCYSIEGDRSNNILTNLVQGITGQNVNSQLYSNEIKLNQMINGDHATQRMMKDM